MKLGKLLIIGLLNLSFIYASDEENKSPLKKNSSRLSLVHHNIKEDQFKSIPIGKRKSKERKELTLETFCDRVDTLTLSSVQNEEITLEKRLVSAQMILIYSKDDGLKETVRKLAEGQMNQGKEGDRIAWTELMRKSLPETDILFQEAIFRLHQLRINKNNL